MITHLHERFMDEGDATRVGLDWLMALGRAHHADRLDTMVGEGSGGSASAWRAHVLIGYFVLLRDPLNWTQLICHDLTEDSRATSTNIPTQKETSCPDRSP